MNSNPKIVVVKMREIIYTLLLLFLVALLIICLVLMFAPGSGTSKTGQVAQNPAQSTQSQTGQTSAAQTNQTSTAQTNQTSAAQTNQTTNAQTDQTAAAQAGQTSAAQTGQTAATQTDQMAAAAARYTPGVYTTPLTLGESTVDVEVTVDSSHINSIRLVNLSESTAASFPLVSPALEHISSQILATQSLESITCPSENKYTSQLLFSAVSDALARAQYQGRP